jgi:hypothetical protein
MSQTGASRESVRSNADHTVWNRDTGQSSATFKYSAIGSISRSDNCQAARNRDTGETGTAIERAEFDACHAAGYRDACESRAPIKHVFVDHR